MYRGCISNWPQQVRRQNFYCSTDGSQYHLVAEQVDTSSLSTEVAGGFVGCCIGMFSSSNGTSSDQVADFDWFEYGSYK